MYLRISRNKRRKNVYEYAQICERYRENGKQKTRILEYLGPVRNEADMERYRKALLLPGEKDSMRRITPEDFSLLPSKEFGIIYASMAVMDNSGILKILRKNLGVYAHILNFMIIARLLEPSSDLSLINLSEMVYYPWSRLDLNDDNIYRTLDKLISAKDSIELEIFQNMDNPEYVKIVFGDKDIPSVFAKYRKPFKKPGMTKNRILKRVDTGTEMMLADSLSDTPYNDKMMDKANEVRSVNVY